MSPITIKFMLAITLCIVWTYPVSADDTETSSVNAYSANAQQEDLANSVNKQEYQDISNSANEQDEHILANSANEHDIANMAETQPAELPNGVQDMDARIIAGNATTIASNKYVVSIRRDGKFICGGALVSNTHVVTSASCVKGAATSRFVVHAGTSFLNATGANSTLSQIYIPSVYTTAKRARDVAVLKLATSLNGTNINPIALCSHKLKKGSLAKITGWGKTKSTAVNFRNQMRSANVKLIGIKACKRVYGNRITNSMMCAQGPGLKGFCTGDLGGPLVSKGQLCGIMSFQSTCGKGKPGVYTAVNTVKRFIQEQLVK